MRTGDRIAGVTGLREASRRTVTGDRISGVTGADVKLRAGRKPGGSAEALAPHGMRT